MRFNNHVGVHGDILGYILASSCLGNFSIAGDVLASIEIYTISGSFAIHGDLLAPFDARTLADFAVNGAGPHTGDITVKYAYPDALTIAGDYAGDMSFLQGVSGQVSVQTDLGGSITVADDLTGSVTVQDDIAADGLIAVGGDLNGFIKIDDTLAGQVRVNGSLLNSAAVNDIWIGTGLDTTGAIAVDWDGWDELDTWASGAVVRVGQTTYTQNTPAARVYEITECKADMNNDGLVGFGDINPFVLAQSNPAGFGDTYPGLAGSMVYHGDLNCDERLDFADIDPFVLRIAEGCCEPTCGYCPGMAQAGPPSPAELATTLKAHTAPELYDAMLDIVAETPLWQSDPAKREYWEEVYDALVK